MGLENIEMTSANKIADDGGDKTAPTFVNVAIDPDEEDTVTPGSQGQTEGTLQRVQKRISGFFSTNEILIRLIVYAVLSCLYFVYFAYAISHEFGDEGSLRLFAVTIIVVFFLLLYRVFNARDRAIPVAITNAWKRRNRKLFNWLYIAFIVAFGVFALVYVIVDVVIYSPKNAIPLGGLAAFITVLYLTSHNPAKVKWQPVILGVYIQFALACLILRWSFGFQAFQWLGDRVTEFLSFSDVGAQFVFGDDYVRHFFAFKVLPVIIFFSAIMSMLCYLGAVQFLINVIGRGMAFAMGTSAVESLNATANIFIGMTDAPLMFRPIIKDLTKSELHAVMTGGFATIAGSVMTAYILYGVPANHLLAASVMSAPAAMAMSKLFYPETEKPKLDTQGYRMELSNDRNLIDAASNGAIGSVKLVANVAVNLIAFISVLAFVNATLRWFGTRAGMHDPTLSFEFICSYVFYPMAFMMGVDTVDSRRVAELIGVKTFLNEFIAYSRLSVFIKNKEYFVKHVNNAYSNYICKTSSVIYFAVNNNTLTGGMMTTRSEVVATYALCGFANIGSMGIMLGALGAMAPSRKGDISRIILRAMIAGNVACFMTACVAGILLNQEQSVLDDKLLDGTLCPR